MNQVTPEVAERSGADSQPEQKDCFWSTKVSNAHDGPALDRAPNALEDHDGT
jgi:hypothetical protein